jgi:hypothetical protein
VVGVGGYAAYKYFSDDDAKASAGKPPEKAEPIQEQPQAETKANAPSPQSGGGDGAQKPPAPPAPPEGAEEPSDEPIRRITNPKHHANSSSPEPKNAQELFDRSIVDKNGVRWAKGSDGTIHRFSKPSNGESHWNGSTAGKDPIKPQNIPNDIKKALGD